MARKKHKEGNCNSCKKCRGRKRHQHTPPSKQYMCQYCGQRFAKQAHCIWHQCNQHKDKPQQLPDEMGVEESSSSSNTEETGPLGMAPYGCEYCGMRFWKARSRKEHQSTCIHRKEKQSLSTPDPLGFTQSCSEEKTFGLQSE